MNRIIFGSANHWTSPYQVGSHAWARLFLRHNWQVAYISDPLTPWHWFNPKNRERNWERFALWKKRGELCEDGKLRPWTPLSLIAPYKTPLLAGHWALEKWAFFTVPSIKKQIEQWGGGSPEILWLDSVRHAIWGKKLNPRFTVLRIADWTAGFHSIPSSILEMERKLLVEADLVITSAKTLENRLKSIRGKRPFYTIRNGVDVSFWQLPCVQPLEYADIPSPRAVYVGALDHWFDLSLLYKLAKALPHISFVIIGQLQKNLPLEQKLPNVHWLGIRSREQVRAYLRHAQVGIIPFKRSELIEHVCPLKLYEYMACGLRVVATRWKEIEQMNSPAQLAESEFEWVENIQKAVSESCSTDCLSKHSENNLPSSIKDMLKYAAANDWQKRWLEWQTIYQEVAGAHAAMMS